MLFTELLTEYLDARSEYHDACDNELAPTLLLDQLEHTLFRARDELNEYTEKLRRLEGNYFYEYRPSAH